MPKPEWLSKFELPNLFEELRFIDKKLTPGLVRVVVGQFYEVLMAKYLKGELTDVSYNMGVQPDIVVWNKRGDKLYEVKSGNGRVIVDCGQMAYYDKLLNTDFPYNKPKIFVVIFYHNLESMSSKFLSVKELVEALCKATLFGALFPFNIFVNIINNIKKNSYNGWSRGERDDDHNFYLNFDKSLFLKNDFKFEYTKVKTKRMKISIYNQVVNPFKFYHYSNV